MCNTGRLPSPPKTEGGAPALLPSAPHWFLGEYPLTWPPLCFRLPSQALSGCGHGLNAGA
eukprot:14983364-Ditylum_brightwellii.AAC.1